MWLGEFNAGDVLDFAFTTRAITGAPTTFAGSPALAVYKGNSTTESTAGLTLTPDFDSITGLNHVRITTASDATFYADGSDFNVIATAGTVGGISVAGEVVGHFTLRNRAALKPTAAGRTLDVSATGEAGIDWANIGSPTTTVGLSGTTIKTATDVEVDTDAIKAKTDNLPSDPADASDIASAFGTVNTTLATIAAYIDTEVGAIKAKTDLLTFTGSAVQSTLVAAGLDAVTLESGVNARQGLCIIFASQAGVLSGADLSGAPQTITIKGGNAPAITRILGTCDGTGNRTGVALTLPA